MKKRVRLLSMLMAALMLGTQLSAGAYTYSFDVMNDGSTQEESGEFILLDVDSKTTITSLGLEASTEYKDEGRAATALWDEHHTQEKTMIEIEDFPTNLFNYSHIYLRFYAPEAYNSKILMYFQCPGGYGSYTHTVTEAGWQDIKIRPSELILRNATDDMSNVNRVYLYVGKGWGFDPNPEAKFYIQDFKLIDDGTRTTSKNSIEASWAKFNAPRVFSDETKQAAEELLSRTVAAHRNIATVLNHGEKGTLSNTNPEARMVTLGGVDMVPVRFFEQYFGANLVNETGKCVITIGDKSLTAVEGSKEYGSGGFSQVVCTMYDELYVPLCDTLDYFGLYWISLDKTYLVGDKALLDTVVREYELSERVSACFGNEELVVTDEDFEKAIDNVQYMYFGGDNDMSDPLVAQWVRAIEATGEQRYHELDRSATETGIWPNITNTNPGERCKQYALYIGQMARAWATKGSKYYQHAGMLDATLFAIEWWYTNIYNMENPDVPAAAGGWFNWNTGTPQYIFPALFALYDVLPPEYISRYCEAIDWINPSSVGGTMADREKVMREDSLNASGNKCWQMQIVIYSSLLQKQTERLNQEINIELRKLFEYVEHVGNGMFHNSVPTGFDGLDNKNGGFYADGSYIDHQYYPYIAGYGAAYLSTMSEIFTALKDTQFYPSDPIMHNQVDWIKKALAPLIYKNNTYWRLHGRSIRNNGGATSTDASRFIGYYLDMLNLVTGDDAEYLKSLIKTQGQYLSNYAVSDRPQNRVKLREIMEDDSIPLMDESSFSKVYFNMAVVSHKRPNWQFNLAMNSTEVGYAEIYKYSGENWNMFHQSDGQTTWYTTRGDEYNGHYWNNIDPTKISGVTSVERPFDFITGSICYAGTHFVGGTTLDDMYTVAAMDFYGHNRGNVTREDNKTDAYYSDLSAHKSWFMFDDEVVCLGSGISTTDGYETITTVDAKRLEGEMIPETSTAVKQYEPVSVTACGDDGNVAANTIDYSYSTRWSYDGTDGWIQYDLGEEKELGYVGIAFYVGDERKTKFELLTSTDGENWQEHFAGESNGTTEDMVPFKAEGKARYIRIECHGNNKTAWNSLSEVHFYPPTADGQMPVNNKSPYIYGINDVWVDGELMPKEDFAGKAVEKVTSVSIDGVGGYYFPEETDLTFDKYTNKETPILDFYTSHGVDPVNETYAYAILPNMDKEQTEAYATNPRFTILKNEPELQSVRHEDLNITGTVFWEAGETDTLKADIPCTINMYDDGNTVRIAIADPSKLSDSAKIRVKIPGLKLVETSSRVSVTSGKGYQDIAIDFSISNDPAFKGKSYRGGTYTAVFVRGDESTAQGSLSGSGSSGGNTAAGSAVNVPVETKLFSDLGSYDWAEEQIEALCQAGVIAKSEDGFFRPGDAVTREEFVKMLVTALGLPLTDAESGFADSSAEQWYDAYLAAAKTAGIVRGKEDGGFGVGETISRQDMAVMLLRALESQQKVPAFTVEEQSFSDAVQIDAYAIDAVTQMQQCGLVSGMGDGRFAPLESANRAQAAVIIKRMIDACKEVGNNEAI